MSMSIIVNDHTIKLAQANQAQAQRIRTLTAALNRLSVQSPQAAAAVDKYKLELTTIIGALIV